MKVLSNFVSLLLDKYDTNIQVTNRHLRRYIYNIHENDEYSLMHRVLMVMNYIKNMIKLEKIVADIEYDITKDGNIKYTHHIYGNYGYQELLDNVDNLDNKVLTNIRHFIYKYVQEDKRIERQKHMHNKLVNKYSNTTYVDIAKTWQIYEKYVQYNYNFDECFNEICKKIDDCISYDTKKKHIDSEINKYLISKKISSLYHDSVSCKYSKPYKDYVCYNYNFNECFTNLCVLIDESIQVFNNINKFNHWLDTNNSIQYDEYYIKCHPMYKNYINSKISFEEIINDILARKQHIVDKLVELNAHDINIYKHEKYIAYINHEVSIDTVTQVIDNLMKEQEMIKNKEDSFNTLLHKLNIQDCKDCSYVKRVYTSYMNKYIDIGECENMLRKDIVTIFRYQQLYVYFKNDPNRTQKLNHRISNNWIECESVNETFENVIKRLKRIRKR